MQYCKGNPKRNWFAILSFFGFGFKFNVNFTQRRRHIFKQDPQHGEISSFHYEIIDLLSFPSAGQSQPKTQSPKPMLKKVYGTKQYTLEYQTTGNNQAIEIRGVKENELDPFAKEKGKHNQGYCKKKKKK